MGDIIQASADSTEHDSERFVRRILTEDAVPGIGHPLSENPARSVHELGADGTL